MQKFQSARNERVVVTPHRETQKRPQNQLWRWIPVAFAAPEKSCESAEIGPTKSESKSVAYKNHTKFPPSGGWETNGPRERISGLEGISAARRFRRECSPLLAFRARRNLGGESWPRMERRRERNSKQPYALPTLPPLSHREPRPLFLAKTVKNGNFLHGS